MSQAPRIKRMQDKKTLEGTPYFTLSEFFMAVWEYAHAADAPDNASLAHDQYFAEQDEWRREVYSQKGSGPVGNSRGGAATSRPVSSTSNQLALVFPDLMN